MAAGVFIDKRWRGAAAVPGCLFSLASIGFILQMCFLNSSMGVCSPLHSSGFQIPVAAGAGEQS